jgi:hypothetical protein
MPTKLKFKFSNEDEVENYEEEVHQAYPMERHGLKRTSITRARSPQATAERYVRRVKIEEVSTNDSTVSLQGALRSTFEFLQLVFGFGAAGLCMYFLGDAISFALTLAVGCVAFFLGYMFIKNMRSNNSDDGKGR